MSNNVQQEVVSSAKNLYQIKKTTVSSLIEKYRNTGIIQLASEKIRIPLRTAGKRIIYIDLVRPVKDQSGNIYDYTNRNRLPLPLSYLVHDKNKYAPASVDEVIENQKRIAGDNFDKYKDNLKTLIENLTFISDVLV